VNFVASAALLAGLLALWVTRRAWYVPWERPATINVALQTLDVLIVMPQWDYWISTKLHALTGVWNCEELIGHVGYMIGMFSLLYLVASRLEMTPAEWRSFIQYRILLPISLAIPLMVALFVQGPGKAYVADTIATDTTKWLHAYWLTMVAFVAYILVQVFNGLRVLRRDPRSRKAATAYLCAISVTAVCCLAFMLELEKLQWVLVRCEVIAYAIAAGYVWRTKQRMDVPDDYLLPG
jgi:hypothetical protein